MHLSFSKAVLPLLVNHKAHAQNLAKQSAMASETHPSSFKQLSYTQTYCPAIQHCDAIFRWSRHCPRIYCRHVTAQESFVARKARELVFTLRSFSSNSDRWDILSDHPRRQSHLLPTTSWPEILSSSSYGPIICREYVTAQIWSSSHYSPRICLFLRLNK